MKRLHGIYIHWFIFWPIICTMAVLAGGLARGKNDIIAQQAVQAERFNMLTNLPIESLGQIKTAGNNL